MEKTKDIKVFPLNVSWSDIGSWDSIYDVLENNTEIKEICYEKNNGQMKQLAKIIKLRFPEYVNL